MLAKLLGKSIFILISTQVAVGVTNALDHISHGMLVFMIQSFTITETKQAEARFESTLPQESEVDGGAISIFTLYMLKINFFSQRIF